MSIDLIEKVKEMISTMNDYVQRSLPELRSLADGFYTEETSEQWSLFSQFIEGLQWMFDAFQSVDAVKSTTNLPLEWTEISRIFRRLEEQVGLLLPAFESKDRTLLGDILNYEISPLFEELQQLLSQSID